MDSGERKNKNAPAGRAPLPGSKAGIVFFALVIMLFVIFMLVTRQQSSFPEISYSAFVRAVESGSVAEVQIIDNERIRGIYRGGNGQDSYFSTIIPYTDDALMSLLEEKQVIVSGAVSSAPFWMYILQFLPIVVVVVFIIIMMRQSAMQNVRAQQFGKSRIRQYDGGKKVVFADVAGQEEAKYELQEVVDFLRNPKKFVRMGAKIPMGVLLVGSPGTGKTLLARAVAGEAGVPFFHISGSDFVEMFVGVGASRVRDLFEHGRRHAPCIIFIDELDAVGRARGAGFGGGHDEREQTLNQMLVEMDGFDTKDGVIVLAATNRPDVLDPALLRPGRFDRQVVVSLPDIKEREAILAVHAKKIPLGPDADLNRLARSTPGMSGADLANVVNEAALFAARKNKDVVEAEDFEEARDKILMGLARKSMVMPERERIMTAYHEAGHALPYYYLENAPLLHKVTIIPRGRALGLTVSLSEEDSYCRTKSWLNDHLVILLGGYAAEMLVYGETTTGTQNDIRQATEIARRMVCEWGMSGELGTVSYGQEDEPLFLGKEIARHKDYSEYTAQRIDMAVKGILDDAKRKALSVLEENRVQLDLLCRTLVEKETMNDREIRELLGIAPRVTAECEDQCTETLKNGESVVQSE